MGAAEIGLRHMEKSGLDDKDAKVKFLYRKGVCNLERGFSEDAYEALKKAEAANPGNKEVRQALKKAKQDQTADKRSAKKVWKSVLLTEEEKSCQGSFFSISVQAARCRARCR